MGTGYENLLFTGLILESFEPISDATFKMNCVDISSRLRKALAQDFGTLEKWDSLRKLSDEDNFEGTYIPERSLLPMQVGTGMARSDRTDLAISRLELPSEGPAEQNTAYMTPMELKTAGGFLDANPLLRFKTDHRSEDVRFLINQLATNKEVYNTEIDIPGVTVDKPFLLNRGSVAFSVEPTRTTRLPVDWVVGVESGLQTPPTILILLSNPERHIADLLVQYDIQCAILIGCCTLSIRASRCIELSGGMPRIITSSRLRRYSKIGVRGDNSRVQTTAQGMRTDSVSRKAVRSRFITIIRG